ncbi:MAG: DNA polymerase I [Firmicutes bacterium]|nr:DNA polymerase I [Bacillota bacterium]
MEEQRLFLIDGNSLINRAFYALPPLTNADGEPTNAVYGLTRMLFRLQDDYQPDQILVAFDVAGPTFRHEKYKEYKAHRKPMPDDLRSQVQVMKEVLDALGILRLESPGFEADDLLGTLARRGEEEGFQVYIVSGDRDTFQLVSPQTRVLFTKRGITETELVDEKTLKDNYGLLPGQVQDFKGLMGDSSDNIPGVPGIGEKTALRLLKEYASIEDVYAHLGQIRGKLKERLEEHKKQAFLSRELATINRQVPLEINLRQKRKMQAEQVRHLFQKLGFRTLLERLPSADFEKDDFREWDSEFQILKAENWPQLQKQLQAAAEIYLLESGREGPLACLVKDEVWIISNSFWFQKRELLLKNLRRKKIYCSSSKELEHLTGQVGFLEIEFDLELALYCLNPEERWDFPRLAARYGLPDLPKSREDLRFTVCSVRLLKKAAPLLEQDLKEAALWDLYRNLELPLASVLAAMEKKGILVDSQRLKEISRDLEETLNRLTKEIYKQAGEEFNINSPKQLGMILFEKMGLPVLKRTKTGPSTSAEVLEELGDYSIVNYVLEYRQVAKLKSTYADALGELISPQSGRIHTTFNQTVTATGRLSSTHPNLQNIPVRTEEGRRIREAFVAPAGFYLLSADYSQIELRVLAHISGDEILRKAFLSGQDIHAQTAAEVFGMAVSKVTPELREAAKAINFGIIYGISSFGLAKGINLTRAQAQEYIDAYFLRYPKVKAYLDNAVKTGKELGYVQTLFKRRRYLPGLKSRNYAARNFAARMAMNSPIQGTAADIIKLAMIKVERALKEAQLESALLLQVHDELVLEVPQTELSAAADLVRREMGNAASLKVPLVVDILYGRNWRDMQVFSGKE